MGYQGSPESQGSLDSQGRFKRVARSYRKYRDVSVVLKRTSRGSRRSQGRIREAHVVSGAFQRSQDVPEEVSGAFVSVPGGFRERPRGFRRISVGSRESEALQGVSETF